MAERLAVVTGGAGGVGLAVVEELSRRGWEVRSWSRRHGIDVSDEAQVERAAAALPRWDALVNAAAMLVVRPLAEMTAAEWDAVLAPLRGAFLCCRAALRRMAPGGAIVNVSSLGGLAGTEKFPGTAAYVAAKSALAGLTEVLAVEGRGLGIRVNALSPGSIRTPMLELSPAPKEPALEPAEVARLVAWLAGPESAPLSGANLRLDPWPHP